MLEPYCRRTEDEVCGALYVAVLEELAYSSASGIDCILVAKEAAVDKLTLVSLYV